MKKGDGEEDPDPYDIFQGNGKRLPALLLAFANKRGGGAVNRSPGYFLFSIYD